MHSRTRQRDQGVPFGPGRRRSRDDDVCPIAASRSSTRSTPSSSSAATRRSSACSRSSRRLASWPCSVRRGAASRRWCAPAWCRPCAAARCRQRAVAIVLLRPGADRGRRSPRSWLHARAARCSRPSTGSRPTADAPSRAALDARRGRARGPRRVVVDQSRRCSRSAATTTSAAPVLEPALRRCRARRAGHRRAHDARRLLPACARLPGAVAARRGQQLWSARWTATGAPGDRGAGAARRAGVRGGPVDTILDDAGSSAGRAAAAPVRAARAVGAAPRHDADARGLSRSRRRQRRARQARGGLSPRSSPDEQELARRMLLRLTSRARARRTRAGGRR